jgi:hypothetical protein
MHPFLMLPTPPVPLPVCMGAVFTRFLFACLPLFVYSPALFYYRQPLTSSQPPCSECLYSLSLCSLDFISKFRHLSMPQQNPHTLTPHPPTQPTPNPCPRASINQPTLRRTPQTQLKGGIGQDGPPGLPPAKERPGIGRRCQRILSTCPRQFRTGPKKHQRLLRPSTCLSSLSLSLSSMRILCMLIHLPFVMFDLHRPGHY